MTETGIPAEQTPDPVPTTPGVPATYLRGALAASPRTLLDVVIEAAHLHPDAPAIDDGVRPLTYTELLDEITRGAAWLHDNGVAAGDRVGIRMPSGTRDLYLAILSVLAAGAAYVPVDADDPDERAELVFSEAGVTAVFTANGLTHTGERAEVPTERRRPPTPDDDAWIIFTSGSTGTPKGVAVTHRSAAAFVDAESRMFLPADPIGPNDRVLAGLSVAFDASCEEMWLAWRHAACLVPAPRSLVRSGVDLGPWLVERGVTVVSTVPTLAMLWPAEALDRVRLLIFGGESCPPELVDRLATESREVWNTYGPTEATVVACATTMLPGREVSIGLPLDGWDLAVVDPSGHPVAVGETGELVIGGVGLARYLDAAKDAEKYAPAPTLGWDRAYRSGDLVRLEEDGLYFLGRADDQVKLGGRRIELGEVDAALQALPGVQGAAAAVQRTAAGHQLLVGYVLPLPGVDFDTHAAHEQLMSELPAALVPRVAVVDDLPTRTSGKVDRKALPWPLPGTENAAAAAGLTGTAAWIGGLWVDTLGAEITGDGDDFFDLGGGSLSAAQLVTAIRERFPRVTVRDLYDNPRLGALARFLDDMGEQASAGGTDHEVLPVPRSAQTIQLLTHLPLATLRGLQWLTWLAIIGNLASRAGAEWATPISWWWVLPAFLLFLTPPGRMAIAVAGTRLLLHGVAPGRHPRGGSTHLRVWAAERLVAASGADGMAGAPWMVYFARALGANIGDGVDLHTLPGVTGMLTLGDGCAVEPEVDLSGHWVDGDIFHLGRIEVGPGAVVGARSTLMPGTVIGADAEIAPGSCVTGGKRVKPGSYWTGSPAMKEGKAKHNWPATRPQRRRGWVPVYGATALALAAMPLIALAIGLLTMAPYVLAADDLPSATARALAMTPVSALAGLLALAVMTLIGVRIMSIGLSEGHHAVRSRIGWQVWTTERLMDAARTQLFPLYAALATPTWLRLLGTKVGRDVEASTVLLIPRFTEIKDGAFLADDTMVASYELGGGWMRIEKAKIGKRAFVGNSGMTAAGRRVPKNALVAVLSATPAKVKAGQSYLGSPPVPLRRTAGGGDVSLTYEPPLRLKAARGAVETLRLLPMMVSAAIGVGVLAGLQAIVAAVGWWWAALVSGLVLLTAGAVAVLVTLAVKWLCVRRIGVSEHPLWSPFVWLNELQDTFVETVAAPWFADAATGTPSLALFLRGLGARIGRGVWCETYWLPEADLCVLGDGATVNRGCVVQTHLFHDRIMSLDTVVLEPGATLGPHCVSLPASVIGADATVGPASLVMRGDNVPPATRWQGNPIQPE